MFLKTVQQAKRFFLILFGFTLLLAGVVMIVTPGPGWPTIFAGLGVLAAAEIVWARRLLDKLKHHGTRLLNSVRSQNGGKPDSGPEQRSSSTRSK